MRYVNTPTYRTAGGKLTMFSAPAIDPSKFTMITPYQVQEHDRMDTIAADFYEGHGELWWIIAAANGFSLPTDLVPGSFIRIPQDYKSVLQMYSFLNSNIT